MFDAVASFQAVAKQGPETSNREVSFKVCLTPIWFLPQKGDHSFKVEAHEEMNIKQQSSHDSNDGTTSIGQAI